MAEPTYRRTPLLIGLIVAACLVGPIVLGLKVPHNLKAFALARQGQKAYQAKQYDQAVDAYKALTALDPNNAKAWEVLAIARYYQRDYPGTIEADTRALQLDPKIYAAWVQRGTAYLATRQAALALDDFSKAIALDSSASHPLAANAYYRRSIALYNLNRLPEALSDVNQALQITPHSALSHNLRGLIEARSGTYDTAIADFSEAISIHSSTEYLTNRAMAYSLAVRHAEQLEDYRKVCSLSPADSIAWNSQAWLLATCPDASIRDGKQAIILACQSCDLSDWKDGACIDTLAAAYAEVGDFPQAIAWQEKSVALAAQNPAMESIRGGMQARLDLFRQGLPYRETANPQPPSSFPL